MRFLRDVLVAVLRDRGISESRLSHLAKLGNRKTVTDIVSGKKKVVELELAHALATALGLPISTFYKPDEWAEFVDSLGANQKETSSGQPRLGTWELTPRSDDEKAAHIIERTHLGRSCLAFSQPYFGHMLPVRMFRWWEEYLCCNVLSRVPVDDRADYLARAERFYKDGQQWLERATFHYSMLTPMEMFEAAAQVEPDWVREFARYVASDDRVKLCVPHPTALKNALKTLKRRTGVSPLYSLSVLDNDMAVVRQVRDVYLHTEHPGHVVKLRSAMKEAFRYIDESATDLATRLDKIARRQAVD